MYMYIFDVLVLIKVSVICCEKLVGSVESDAIRYVLHLLEFQESKISQTP